jgi:hypothetical protein
MKTAPFFGKKVSEYTSQCDQGDITVGVGVIRIRRFPGQSAMQGSVVASQQTL